MSNISDEERYYPYFLRGNPFPQMAIIDPYSTDVRLNGMIFNKEIFQEETADLRQKIDSRINLIYITGGGWERGVGKSALMVQEWKRLTNQPNITSIYVKVRPKSGPSDFCDDIVLRWHEGGFLWDALKKLLLKYAEEVPSPKIESSDVRAFISTYPKMTDEIRFGLFSFLYKIESVVADVAKWIRSRSYLAKEKIVQGFLETYLTKPSSFPDEWLKITRKKGTDKIECFRTLMELLRISGYLYHYFFLDQFEETIEPLRGASLSVFSTGMSSLLRACAGQATITVTLHPVAEQALAQPEGKHVISLASLDKRHKIDVNTMSPPEGIKLCVSYTKLFRRGKPHDPLYPFNEDAVGYLTYLANGVPRLFLESMNRALEIGVSENYALLTLDFLKQHHEEITGKVFMEEKLKEYLEYAK
jgi:hypothetical protein